MRHTQHKRWKKKKAKLSQNRVGLRSCVNNSVKVTCLLTYPVEHFWIHLEESLNFDKMGASAKLPQVLRRVAGPSLTLERWSPSRQLSQTSNKQDETLSNPAIAAPTKAPLLLRERRRRERNTPHRAPSEPLDGNRLRFRLVHYQNLWGVE